MLQLCLDHWHPLIVTSSRRVYNFYFKTALLGTPIFQLNCPQWAGPYLRFQPGQMFKSATTPDPAALAQLSSPKLSLLASGCSQVVLNHLFCGWQKGYLFHTLVGRADPLSWGTQPSPVLLFAKSSFREYRCAQIHCWVHMADTSTVLNYAHGSPLRLRSGCNSQAGVVTKQSLFPWNRSESPRWNKSPLISSARCYVGSPSLLWCSVLK